MSTNNAGSRENVTIERMRQWQARALAGRIREGEMSGKDYIKHAGQQESSLNPMKTLEQDYTDKKNKWDETSMGLLLIPIIGWLIVADRYGDYKQSERAWGTKVKSERKKDEDFVKNFQENFKKMSQAERNQLCQIGEQFCGEKGFDIKKFIKDSKELSTDEQVVQLENRIKEMNSQITGYKNMLSGNSLVTNTPVQTAKANVQAKPNPALITTNQAQERLWKTMKANNEVENYDKILGDIFKDKKIGDTVNISALKLTGLQDGDFVKLCPISGGNKYVQITSRERNEAVLVTH